MVIQARPDAENDDENCRTIYSAMTFHKGTCRRASGGAALDRFFYFQDSECATD